ncbi:FkbM family methyltransferase [Micromonospora sp. URMC 103]|uniref:FkbM family methyltransferase n=1 Tax=Micromonospora sp. URMC 103 TaxID=3423406 RepID=UPI003F1D4160
MDARTGAIEALKTDPATVSLRRSLEVYYGHPAREAAMDAFYARFVRPGDLVFDVGAHVGDRVGSFRRLGARVVAVEPQPPCTRALRAIYGRDDGVTVVEAVCGDRAGRVPFNVNSANPTISTASAAFIRAADGAAGWAHERWDARIEVPAVTLDGLVADHGVPAFVKIDVEGFEDAVLAGLTRPLPALSFEFTTIERAVARRCLRRLTALGFHSFNLALGDAMALASSQWMSAARMAAHLESLPHEANSGDVYCLSRAHLRRRR